MPSLGESFRSRATEQQQHARTLFESPEFGVDPQKQALFVAAKVTANMLQLLGEVIDYLRAADNMDAAAEHRAKILEKSNAIRNAAAAAAATGNWDDFDRIASEFGTGGSQGSD